ncbi:MAG: hypothetical protein ACPL68_06970, partial [Candidatus Hydrothermia bacterium]
LAYPGETIPVSRFCGVHLLLWSEKIHGLPSLYGDQPSNGQRAMEPGEVAVDLRANMATEVSAKGSPGSPTTYFYVLS